ncbi:cytochrome c3 family protein [Slackia heliotrinireducens]|uniref:cytochrome c3 family protein n=1 Tax=Slackia heliotrinireducens TaxID=84110 RepID=UPI003315CD5B
MKATQKNKLTVFAFAFALAAVFAIAVGCSQNPAESGSDEDAPAVEQGAVSEDAAAAGTPGEVTEALFEVSDFDANCLECHGGSYEAVAELTSDLGIWNPHDSFHGGYNSCQNCHAEDMSVEYNYCSQCHAYAPTEDGLFLEDPWQ